jgi:Domain of unknown function (DUF6904)
MLGSQPTNKGAGIILYGDETDMGSALGTVRNLYDGPPFRGNLEGFLYDLAGEFDSAALGTQVPIPRGHHKPSDPNYRWVIRSWPRFLTELSVLRWGAGFHPTTKSDQASLYSLEACAESALMCYDAAVGREVIGIMDCFTGLPASFLPEFITQVEAWYVDASKTGKTRFARLPHYLRMTRPYSEEYRAFEKQMQSLAAEKGCKAEDLEMEKFLEFKW